MNSKYLNRSNNWSVNFSWSINWKLSSFLIIGDLLEIINGVDFFVIFRALLKRLFHRAIDIKKEAKDGQLD